ncbi:hypothetical protein NADFUDRAFT_49704 [Nadsonia fulvescens var. elongata DSM 6958]|uniref:D-aminoacid aminotransferase-like PLP-dependent enzyme n=1 Tax=Nadsonia fulvescens var. elongata DSM 6958 TaxID=857566 RepID=A0A1E3PR01_9ASCO|nr:hypothetical protein NADFUDRAFT_49704 [Nadsonia fulvescens var. elongata DSM 6958]
MSPVDQSGMTNNGSGLQANFDSQDPEILKVISNLEARLGIVNETSNQFDLLSAVRYIPFENRSGPDFISRDSALIDKERFFLFDNHLERFKIMLQFFSGTLPFPTDISSEELLEALQNAVQNPQFDTSKPHKMRVIIKQELPLKIVVETTPVTPRVNLYSALSIENTELADGPSYTVKVDSDFSMASFNTMFKTTARETYNAARARCLDPMDPSPQEVIIYNGQGEIMEGSISNIAFWRNGEWVTPLLTTGCLCGVMRHDLLMKDYIKEEDVHLNTLKQGEQVLLFNGIQGVVKGTIDLSLYWKSKKDFAKNASK